MSTFQPAANATTRFSDRVDNYIRYRPGYPPQLAECLVESHGLKPGDVIADVGSGTGLSAEILLRRGHVVYAVEPNREMREAAERLLMRYPGFRSTNGAAEATTLDNAAVDWVFAGQAFHWFDVARARAEFRRILRPPGRVAIFWNVRREDTPFLVEYERLLKAHAIDYEQVKHQNAEADGRIGELFGGAPSHRHVFANQQRFDFDGLLGRALSSSYVPGPGHPRHAGMLIALRDAFDRHAISGTVVFEYETRLYIGSIAR